MSKTLPPEPTPGKPSTPPPHIPAQRVAPAQAAPLQSLSDSPFAKMFERAGMALTAKQLTQVINNLLRQVIDQIKKSDEGWKRAMRKLDESSDENS